MEGQLSIFDVRPIDKHSDRYGRKHNAPSWMKYERCENCVRWVMYPTEDQPPCGWGIYGFCNEHKQKVAEISYCRNWEDKYKL